MPARGALPQTKDSSTQKLEGSGITQSLPTTTMSNAQRSQVNTGELFTRSARPGFSMMAALRLGVIEEIHGPDHRIQASGYANIDEVCAYNRRVNDGQLIAKGAI